MPSVVTLGVVTLWFNANAVYVMSGLIEQCWIIPQRQACTHVPQQSHPSQQSP
ncbi:MAG: hypothetical protein ABFD47_06275 [Armatimonadota bacterium]